VGGGARRGRRAARHGGLNPVPPGIITGEGLEIGWRLARHAWGRGYATEAGRAAVDVARRIGAQSVWSFTSVGNERSQAVMRRLGLSFVRYFDHPNVPDGQSTRPHARPLSTRPRRA
jgi:RimJ/RimL family protein N-acetyltransferase